MCFLTKDETSIIVDYDIFVDFLILMSLDDQAGESKSRCDILIYIYVCMYVCMYICIVLLGLLTV